MTGRKLALLATSLAGGAVLTWTIVETLRDSGTDRHSAAESAANSPIARLVAREGPREGAGLAASAAMADVRWEGWSRAAAELAGGDALAGGTSDGRLGDRDGRSAWNGDKDLDGASGRLARLRALASERNRRHGEPELRYRPYRLPRAGRPTILTSGRRLRDPEIRLPERAARSLSLEDGAHVPVRIEVCVRPNGRPDEARVVDGTGVDAVDAYVARRMLVGRYRPLWHNGRRVAFCERTTVVLGG
jgi:hypothetical protein